MIGAAIAALGFVSPASAQNDAAEKAKEGGIEHWIEYYKAERRKPAQDALPPHVDRTAPAGQSVSGVPQSEKTERK